MMNEEEALVRAFVVKAKQAPLIELLGKPGRRQDVTATFDHFRGLDPRFVVRLPPNEQMPESIARALALRGAGDTLTSISRWSRRAARLLACCGSDSPVAAERQCIEPAPLVVGLGINSVQDQSTPRP